MSDDTGILDTDGDGVGDSREVDYASYKNSAGDEIEILHAEVHAGTWTGEDGHQSTGMDVDASVVHMDVDLAEGIKDEVFLLRDEVTIGATSDGAGGTQYGAEVAGTAAMASFTADAEETGWGGSGIDATVGKIEAYAYVGEHSFGLGAGATAAEVAGAAGDYDPETEGDGSLRVAASEGASLGVKGSWDQDSDHDGALERNFTIDAGPGSISLSGEEGSVTYDVMGMASEGAQTLSSIASLDLGGAIDHAVGFVEEAGNAVVDTVGNVVEVAGDALEMAGDAVDAVGDFLGDLF